MSTASGRSIGYPLKEVSLVFVDVLGSFCMLLKAKSTLETKMVAKIRDSVSAAQEAVNELTMCLS